MTTTNFFDTLTDVEIQIIIAPSHDNDDYCWLPDWFAGNLLGRWRDNNGDTVLVVPYQGRFYNVPARFDEGQIVIDFNNFLFPLSGFLREFGLEKYIMEKED